MESCHNQTTGLTRVIPFVMDKVASGVRLTLLYISSEAVIPAKAEILKVQFILHWDLFFGFP